MNRREAIAVLFGVEPDTAPTKRELRDKADAARDRIDEALAVLMVHFGHETQERYDNPCMKCSGDKKTYDPGSVVSGTFKQVDCPRCGGSGVDPFPALANA